MAAAPSSTRESAVKGHLGKARVVNAKGEKNKHSAARLAARAVLTR